jgi:hypothetical protein
MRIDEETGSTRWRDAINYELTKLKEHKAHKDHGEGVIPPKGCKKILMHLVFDVKHDGKARAHLVANGNMTEVPAESVCSGVVSLRGVCLITFLAELNNLELWGADVNSAYLEAKTSEKIYFIAGPEFGDLQGHVMVTCEPGADY